MRRAEGDLRAMVLAAGLGTRLRPLTDGLPKPLVPVLGVPLLEGTLELLARSGVSRAVVNLHHLACVLREVLDGLRPHLDVALDLVEEPILLGTGGGLKNAAPLLLGARAVLLVNGDTLLDADLGAMVSEHFRTGAAATLLVRTNPDPVAYPPVWTDARLRVHRIAALPEGPLQDDLRPWLFAGVHVLDPAVLDRLPDGASDVNRVLHPQLIARGDLVRAFPSDGMWSDVGTPERLLDANLRALAAAPARLLDLAMKDGYTREGDALVGRDVARSGSLRLSRSVVGHGSSLGIGASIERSVLFPGVEVGAGARVVGSVLGPMASVRDGERIEHAFLVGDQRLPIPTGHGG